MILFPLGEGEEGDNKCLLGDGMTPRHPPAATNPWINPQPSTHSIHPAVKCVESLNEPSCHCALCQHESRLRLFAGLL